MWGMFRVQEGFFDQRGDGDRRGGIDLGDGEDGGEGREVEREEVFGEGRRDWLRGWIVWRSDWDR